MVLQEVAEGLKRMGWTEIPPDLQAIMEEVDSDKSGHIDYTGRHAFYVSGSSVCARGYWGVL